MSNDVDERPSNTDAGIDDFEEGTVNHAVMRIVEAADLDEGTEYRVNVTESNYKTAVNVTVLKPGWKKVAEYMEEQE